jgi:hypothetical protein
MRIGYADYTLKYIVGVERRREERENQEQTRREKKRRMARDHQIELFNKIITA